MPTRVTSKGQVTIPKRTRDYLELKPGNSVEFRVSDTGEIVIRKVLKGKIAKRPKPSVEKSGGFKFPPGIKTTDEYMIWLRGDPDDDYR
jgi:AbrB family looped-hinge helix DNA binding protein